MTEEITAENLDDEEIQPIEVKVINNEPIREKEEWETDYRYEDISITQEEIDDDTPS